MSEELDEPFLTEDFSTGGGGIDFLGLRFVNLRILGDRLVPQINNAVRDAGTFYLGAWIPWKFRQLCETQGQSFFTEENYRKFREKIEVAMSIAMRDEGSAGAAYGLARNRVGNNQSKSFSGNFSFENASRKRTNTIFSAPLYGPSLKYLGLVRSSDSMAEDGTLLNIALSAEDPDTLAIVESVDASLRNSSAYDDLASLRETAFSTEEVDSLGSNGLSPSCYKAEKFSTAKSSFCKKLLPADVESPGFARTLTAVLMLRTLEQKNGIDLTQVKNAWYTGMFDDGSLFQPLGQRLESQREIWGVFMAKQYQRYFIELFLWCLESAIKEGCSSIEEAVRHWETRSDKTENASDLSLRDFLDRHADRVSSGDNSRRSARWNSLVHAGSDCFEYHADPKCDEAPLLGLEMLAGWYWRMLDRRRNNGNSAEFSLGGSDRMSINWFIDWVESRSSQSIRKFLAQVFNELVFSQHIRIALSRFDGNTQRLRFAIGDDGLEQVGQASNFGGLDLPWMADRLDSFSDLLGDLDVVTKEDGKIFLGPRASAVSSMVADS